MTECPVICRSKKEDKVGNSVGKLLSNMTARVVDPNGRNVGPNTPGELYIRQGNCGTAETAKDITLTVFLQSSKPDEGLLQQ